MSKRIKGITIEIGSDTVGLQKALSDVNKKSTALRTELTDVERLLKFNPGNVEALAQKQKLLTEQVGATTEKLNQLKEAEKQVQDQFEKGKITEEQYRNFRREIEFTEGSLNSLNNKIKNMKEEQQNAEAATKTLGNLLRATGTDAEGLAKVVGDRIATAFKNGTASTKDLERAIDLMAKEALGADLDLEKLKKSLSSLDIGSSIKKVEKELKGLAKEAKNAEQEVFDLKVGIENVAGALVAGGGIAGTISQALDISTLERKIDISFEVPEASKNSIKQAVRDMEAYGVDAESALEGVRRQWALNKDASDDANRSVVNGASIIASNYAGIDFTELIQETNEISNSLKISNEESLGLVNSLLKMGFPPEQLDIIAEYGTQLEMAGYNAEEIQSLFAAGVETGTWNIDNLLDGLKEGRIRMAEFGDEVPKTTANLLKNTNISEQQLMKWGKSVAKGGKEGSKAMEEVSKALLGVEDETTKNLLGVQIFGTMWEDQGENILDTVLGASEQLSNLKDNQDSLNDSVTRMDADPLVQLKQAGADVKEALEPLLGVIAESAGAIGEWAKENPKLASTITAIAVAIGVLIGAAAAIAPIVTAVAAMGGATAAAGAVLAALTGPVGIAIAAVAALGFAAYKTSEELKKPALEIEGFGDKVSEETQKAVGSYLDLNDQATVAINQLAWSQQTVTEEMANNLTAIYGEMGDAILSEMKADHEAQLAETSNFFSRTSSLTEEEEAKILANLQANQEEQQAKVTEGQSRISEILTTSKDEKRAITEAEQMEIAAIQEEMKVTAVRVMSESEAEQEAILENLKTNATEITAQQAAEVVQNATKQKDDVVKEAEDQYNNAIAEIVRMRDESGVISEEQAKKLIEEAKKQRDGVIDGAEATHQKVVEEAKAQAGEHVSQVDWETGQVKSKWQVMKEDVGQKMSDMGDDISDKWDRALFITKIIGKEIKEEGIQKFVELRDGIKEKIESARDTISTVLAEIKGFFTNLVLKIPTPELPKLPKFNLETSSTEVLGKTITYPTGFGVEWYKKGGVFTKPIVFGNAGFGDVNEAIVPFEGPHADRIATLIADRMPRSQENTQNFHFYQHEISPSEVARKNKQALRELGMGL
ncbi:DUF2207 domain-containing protein [Mangrovibacillus cuniculi]|uniref:DUF2207 domain-containing protein n=1 Tax=Mangrovibacillus cuniculi TaxID=2593652 RepID=A0A7S8HFU5_9BACI|nr:DUF2207 domain-containing protein [Mangrovibacillus cuniculi]QPC47107.1 DUF2207 domain-containing protein [Mangrovibacillus cuniculi]